jgi:hypothetical protein
VSAVPLHVGTSESDGLVFLYAASVACFPVRRQVNDYALESWLRVPGSCLPWYLCRADSPRHGLYQVVNSVATECLIPFVLY